MKIEKEKKKILITDVIWQDPDCTNVREKHDIHMLDGH